MYLFLVILVILFQNLKVYALNNDNVKSFSETESATTKDEKLFNKTNSKRNTTTPIEIDSTASTERYYTIDDKIKYEHPIIIILNDTNAYTLFEVESAAALIEDKIKHEQPITVIINDTNANNLSEAKYATATTERYIAIDDKTKRKQPIIIIFNDSKVESSTFGSTILYTRIKKSVIPILRTNGKKDIFIPIHVKSTVSTQRYTTTDDKIKHEQPIDIMSNDTSANTTLSEVESSTLSSTILYTAREYNRTIDGDEPQEPVFRIVNGQPASATDVPFQISFRSPSSKTRSKKKTYWTFCGGALIARHKILTAAHCFDTYYTKSPCGRGHVEGKLLGKYFAVAGNLFTVAEYKRNDSTESGQWRRLKNVWYPSKYKFPKNDIAVVTVTRRFRYNDYVKPVNFTYRRIDWTGKCEASGFGRTSNAWKTTAPQPTKLQKAILDLLPNAACRRRHGSNMAKFVCVTSGTTSTASGDSGGPLVCRGSHDPRDSGSGVLVGITCGTRYIRQRPVLSFFTNVGFYTKFIHKSNTSLLSPTLILLPSLCLFVYYTACS